MNKVHNRHANTAPPDAVYIGRGSKWGNPYHIGRDGTRNAVCDKYETYLLGNKVLMNSLHELRGKDLVCSCAPERCHGDTLLRLANK